MLFLVGLLLFCLLSLACGSLWFLYKDREAWRTLHNDLLASSRQREQELFDSLLKSKGIKPLVAKPKVEEVESRTVFEPEDFADYEDRLQERVEYGVMTEEHKRQMLVEARMGHRTKEQLDLDLWANPVAKYTGSENDVF